MKTVNMRIWAVCIAAGFLVLWLASMLVCSVTQEPQPQQTVRAAAMSGTLYVADSDGWKTVGVLGWCLVGLGTVVVAVTGIMGVQPRFKRRSKRRNRVSMAHASRAGHSTAHITKDVHTTHMVYAPYISTSHKTGNSSYTQPKITRTKALTVEVVGYKNRTAARSRR